MTTEYNIGTSNYSEMKIQPWMIWEDWKLDPWDADIIKRIARTKAGDPPELDYEKIIHICKHKIKMIKNESN